VPFWNCSDTFPCLTCCDSCEEQLRASAPAGSNGIRKLKPEPKVQFAAERTLIKWQQVALLLLGIGLGVLSLSTAAGMRGFGFAIAIIAALVSLYSLCIYRWRMVKIIHGETTPGAARYDDRLGPLLLTVLVASVAFAVVALTTTIEAEFLCTKAAPQCAAGFEPGRDDMSSVRVVALTRGALGYGLDVRSAALRAGVCRHVQRQAWALASGSSNGGGSSSGGSFGSTVFGSALSSSSGDSAGSLSSSSSSSVEADAPTLAQWELDETRYCFLRTDESCRDVFALHKSVASDDGSSNRHSLALFVRNNTDVAAALRASAASLASAGLSLRFDHVLAVGCEWGRYAKLEVTWAASADGSGGTAPACSAVALNSRFAAVLGVSPLPVATVPALSLDAQCTLSLRAVLQFERVPLAALSNATVVVAATFPDKYARAMLAGAAQVDMSVEGAVQREGAISFSTLMQGWSVLEALYAAPLTQVVLPWQQGAGSATAGMM
jgi:uncharacterized membrane protein YidH (DUF202 family)